MLTLANVKQLRDSLEVTKTICDEMLQTRQREKLFNSNSDHDFCKCAQMITPQEYYKFRWFDSEITLNYDMKRKMYYLYFDTFDYNFLRNSNFKNNFDNDDISFIDDKKYYINKDYEFITCVNIFGKVCMYFLKNKVSSDKLFEVF